MTSPFRRIYPNTGDSVIYLDGGLSSKFPVTTILDNESPDCQNVIFENGAAETRQGVTVINDGIATAPVNGLYTRHDNDGSQTMIAFVNGTAYDYQATTFATIGSAQSVFTTTARIGSAEYENNIYFGDGENIPYKYNGTDWTRHGVYPPTSTLTAATNSNGTLTGDYQYKVTYVNSASAESDVGPVNSTFSATAEEVLLSSIPVAPQSYGIASRKIYRTEAGGTEFKLLTTISDNTTTTYTDNSDDTELGATAPTDNGVPPTYNIIKYHQDRLFMDDPANKNLLWYTDLGEPYTVQSTNFQSIGDNNLDVVKGFEVFDNGILVFGGRTITLIYMPDTDPTNWIKIVSNSILSSRSPFGLCKFGNSVLLPATLGGVFQGFARFEGITIQPDATLRTVSTSGSYLLSDKMEDQIDNIQNAYIQNISAINYKDRIYITCTYGTGQATNNRIYVFDTSISNLSRKQRYSWAPWTGLNASQFTIYDNNLYYGSSDSDGKVYQMFDGTYTDDGAAIDSYLKTKEFMGFRGDENFHKDFRYLRLLVDKAGAYFMNVLNIQNSDKGVGSKNQIDLNPGGSLWGTMRWGLDTWGGGTNQEDIKIFLGSAKGNRIQFVFNNQNTAGQRFKVHWIKYSYNLKGFR